MLTAAGSFVFYGLPLFGWTKAIPAGRRDEFATATVNMVRDGDAARAVGRAYLTEYPSEAPQRIFAGLQLLTSTAGTVRGATRQAREITGLRRAIRRDFAIGDTVEVDGWILSRTEARICALTARA